MNMIRTGFAAALTACLAIGSAQAGQAEQLHTWSVGLDADGRVASWQLHNGQDGGHADQIAQQLRQWRFESRNPGQQPVQTFVRVISQAGADGQLRILEASTGPAPDRLTLPEYPAAAQRFGEEGVVVLRLQLDAEGRVQTSQVHDTRGQVGRRMAASAVAAARSWQFIPEQVAGQAVAGEVLFPVCFYVSPDPSSVCGWEGPRAEEMSALSIVSLSPVTQLMEPPLASSR